MFVLAIREILWFPSNIPLEAKASYVRLCKFRNRANTKLAEFISVEINPLTTLGKNRSIWPEERGVGKR